MISLIATVSVYNVHAVFGFDNRMRLQTLFLGFFNKSTSSFQISTSDFLNPTQFEFNNMSFTFDITQYQLPDLFSSSFFESL